MSPAVEPRASSISSLNSITVTAKNIQSAYLQTDSSAFLARLDNEIPIDASIVIQYGSLNVKVGMAKDALPHSHPQCIAHKHDSNIRNNSSNFEETESIAELINERITARYKQAKKKPPPNMYSSIISYNKSVVPQAIPALNDAYSMDEWTATSNSTYIIGKDALRINPEEPYLVKWPIKEGNFNLSQYKSCREVIDDLQLIWSRIIIKDLKIPASSFPNYGVAIIVPNNSTASECRALTELILKQMRFKAVSIIPQTLSATFGSGVSASLVLDVGFQTTSVSIVEEGRVLKDHQISLPYGGEVLTKLLFQSLQMHEFPYSECNLNNRLDWELMDDLKARLCTLDEEDITSSIYEAYVRSPGHSTKVYSFKVFEERIIVPTALFEDGVPLLAPFIKSDNVVNDVEKFFEGFQMTTDPLYYPPVSQEDEKIQSVAQMEDVVESEVGITDEIKETNEETSDKILSIMEAIRLLLSKVEESGTNTAERLKKLLSSILVIGNGHRFPKFINYLEDMLRQYYPQYEVEFVLGGGSNSIVTKENIVMDPGVVSWRGGAVFTRLECISDFWISQRDYEMMGIRSFRERLIHDIF